MSLRAPCFALLSLAGALAAAPAHAADPEIDPAFGSNGWRRLFQPGGGTQDEVVVAFERTADDGYVVAAALPGGGANGGTGRRIGLFRLDRDGHFVTSGFGGSGTVVKDAWLTYVTGMTIDAQGRIVVVGGTPGAGGLNDFAVVRFNPDGSDDTSFAGDGGLGYTFERGSASFDEIATSVTTDSVGGIIVAGNLDLGGGDRRFGVVRFHADGAQDTAFGNTQDSGAYIGTIATFRPDENAHARRILRVFEGYYLVAGSTEFSETDWDFAARLLTPTGETLADYAGSERFPIDEPGANGSLSDSLADAIAVDAQTILLVGTTTYDGKFAATRIRIGNGADTLTWDPTFVGSANPVRPNRFVGSVLASDCGSAAVDAHGRIMLVGDTASTAIPAPFDIAAAGGIDGNLSSRRGLLTRLAADGSPDASFGTHGSFLVTAPGGSGSSFYTMFASARFDGAKLVVAGSAVDDSSNVTDFDGMVTRFDSDEIFADGFD